MSKLATLVQSMAKKPEADWTEFDRRNLADAARDFVRENNDRNLAAGRTISIPVNVSPAVLTGQMIEDAVERARVGREAKRAANIQTQAAVATAILAAASGLITGNPMPAIVSGGSAIMAAIED